MKKYLLHVPKLDFTSSKKLSCTFLYRFLIRRLLFMSAAILGFITEGCISKEITRQQCLRFEIGMSKEEVTKIAGLTTTILPRFEVIIEDFLKDEEGSNSGNSQMHSEPTEMWRFSIVGPRMTGFDSEPLPDPGICEVFFQNEKVHLILTF
ncbi:hypothetical protein [Leptospira yasudae]|nr:hypothetical protein [Leptospira yasudae]